MIRLFALILMMVNIAKSSSNFDEIPCLLKPTSSEERFGLAKEIIANNPDLTMRTPVPNLYHQSWIHDFNFAKQQIESQIERPGQSDILNALMLINRKVSENIPSMSFGYLNFIWGVVGDIFSSTSDELFKFNEHKLDSLHAEYNTLLDTVEARFRSGKLYQANSIVGGLPIHLDQILMSPPGIFVLPHVSKTGLVTIQKMIEGLAFTVNGRNYALAFLGIGTNEKLSYDSFENRNARDTRIHDCRHLQAWHLCGFEFYGYGGSSPMTYRFTREHQLIDEAEFGDDAYSSPQNEIDMMIQFKGLIHDMLDKPSVLYYLFSSFHENLRRNETLVQTLINMQKSFTPSRYYTGTEIDQQYRSNMSDGKSLMPRAFEWDGETIEEQYQSYLAFYNEGHRLVYERLNKLS